MSTTVSLLPSSDAATGRSGVLPVPTTVIFDLGGVLIDWNPRYLYRHLFADTASMEQFLAEVCSPGWNARQDAGRPWAEAVQVLSARHPQQASLIQAYDTHWARTLGGALEDTVGILETLKLAGVDLVALTNWSQEKFPIARQRFDFLGWFRAIVVSGEEGLAKPDPALYERAIARFGIDPAQAVFIDDSPENVAAARACGLQAITFIDAPTLRRELRALGLPA